MKKNLKNIIIIIAMVVVGFGVYYLIDKVANKYRWENQTENVTENTVSSKEAENAIKENNVEEKKSTDDNSKKNDNQNDNKANKELKEIVLSEEEIIAMLIDTDPFEGADELSTEKKLEIVYNALNENKINAYKNRGEGQAKVEYTEGEINGIVYSLFGTKLKENKSLGTSFVYKDGKYILEHSDRGEEIPEAKNIEYDVGAGTLYINYDLYVNGTLKGSYAIGKSNVTKYVTCKKEM